MVKVKKAICTNWDDVPVFIDLPYLSNLLGVTYDRVKTMAQNGEIPAKKIGKLWRIKKEDLLKWYENL